MDLPNHPPVLQYCLSAKKTGAFNCTSEVSITWPWRPVTRCFWSRLYPPGRSGNSNRRFNSYGKSGLSMLCWNSGIYLTFTNVPSKDFAPLTLMLRTSSSTDSSTSATQIVVKYDEVDDDGGGGGGEFVKELSKVEKPQRPEKSQISSVWRN